MKRSSPILAAALLSACLAAPAAAQTSPLKATPFHSNGIYNLGEKAGWTISLRDGVTADPRGYSYTIKTNDWDVVKTGTFDLSSGSATIETTVGQPAMLHVTISPVEASPPPAPETTDLRKINDGLKALLVDKDSSLKPFFKTHPDLNLIAQQPAPPPAATAAPVAVLGAAIAPTQLKPVVPRPADFDSFWAGKLAELKKVPINAVLVPTPTTQPGVKLFTVTLDSVGSHVHGYLARPEKRGRYPALVIYQWAGVYKMDSSWATNRAAEGWLVFDVDAHDMAPDEATAPTNYNTVGFTNRETCYFLNMYLRDVRALDFIKTLPTWDRKTIVLNGTSMGGQQSLVMAGLKPDGITAVVVNEPSGDDFDAELHGRRTGYPFWPADNPQAMETGPYFDTISFAPHIKAPALIAVGFIDSVVTPAGVWTAYNQIPGPKEIVPMVNSDHNNMTPQEQSAYLQRSEEVLATILHGGKFIPNPGTSLPRP